MFTWHRVFGSLEQEPAPAELCETLLRQGLPVRPSFRGDDNGWFSGQLDFANGTASVRIERFLIRTEGLRPELNSWCAWVDSLPATAEQGAVLDALVCTTQLFTMYADAESAREPAAAACLALCRWLARQLRGIYQIDGQGVFDEGGRLLLAETAERASP